MVKVFKKILKYTARTLLTLILLIAGVVGGACLYVKTDAGKARLTRYISSLLTKELGIKVNIGLVDFRLPDGADLSDVKVYDHKGNLMIGFGTGQVSGFRYLGTTGEIILGDVALQKVEFNLRHYAHEPNSNLEYLIDRLTPKKKGPSTKGTDIAFNNISLTDTHFKWDNDNVPFAKHGIDWDHVEVSDLNGKFGYLEIGNDIRGKVYNMSLKESSGFTLEDMHTDLIYGNKEMEFSNLYIRTPESEVRDYIRFNYRNMRNFDDFIDSVDFKGNFRSSTVSMKDIAYFTNALENRKDIAHLNNGIITGRINNMKLANMDVAFGDTSYFLGNGRLKGLPNINETFIDANVYSARSSRKELMRYLPETELPAEIDKFGVVQLKGHFTGFITDFVTYGTLKTELGDIESDLNMKLAKSSAATTYSGNLSLTNFNLRRLTGENILGNVTMTGEINGSGLRLEDIRARMKANFSRLDLNNYAYQNIKVNGEFSSRFFNGELAAADKNLDMLFQGTVDYNKKPIFKGHANIENADLLALHLAKDTVTLRSKVDFDFSGIHPDDMNGYISAKKSVLSTPYKSFLLDTVIVVANNDTPYRSLMIYSDLLKANLKGKFNISQLPDLVKANINRYADSGFLHLKGRKVKDQNVSFNISFNGMEPVWKILGINLILEDSGYLKGNLASEYGATQLEGKIPGIKYEDYSAQNLTIASSGKANSLDFTVKANSFNYKDSMLLRDVRISGISNNDLVTFDIFSADANYSRRINLKGKLDMNGDLGLITFDSSRLLIGDTAWQISSKTIAIHNLDSLIEAPLITFSHGRQQLKIIGKYSSTKDYPIRIVVEDVSVAMLSSFVPEIKALSGDINGQVLINNIKDKPIVEAAIFVSPLIFNKDTLGILRATTTFDQSKERLAVDCVLKNYNTEEEVLSALGNINLGGGQTMDMNVHLNETPLGIFQPIFDGVMSNLQGKATASLAIGGTLKRPDIKGDIFLDQTSLKVDYLQTTYRFSHHFKVRGKVINVDNLEMRDVYNSEARINGFVYLNNFTDIGLNLRFNFPQPFLVLNTRPEHNELFYGTGVATGFVTMKGPLDNLDMYIKMHTERGTQFNLPIGQANSYSGYDFIRFVDKKKKTGQNKSLSLKGINLNMDLSVTPEAQMRIIFDPKVGDMIEGNGYSKNISLKITSDGNFNMQGTFAINQGTYSFTAYDIINKQFIIQKGSTVSWTGSPYDAELNVLAVHKVRTSVGPLMAGTDAGNTSTTNAISYSRIFPVEAQLSLTGKLFSPDIKLGFEVNDLSSVGASSTDIDNQIRRIKSDDQETNKQVVSLLVFNRFTAVSQGIGSGDAGLSSLNTGLGDFVNHQLNSWIAKYSQDFQLGVDYRKGEGPTLRANANLFENRVEVNVNYNNNTTRPNTFDAEARFKINQEGSKVVKIQSRSNNNPVIVNENTNTVGVGVSYRKEFDNLHELLFGKKKPGPVKAAPKQEAPKKIPFKTDAGTDLDTMLDIWRKYVESVQGRLAGK